MATLYQTGNSIDYTPDTDVTAGDVVDLSGDMCFIGIAPNDIDASTKGALQIKGVFIFDLAQGASFDVGDKVYVDNSGDASTSSDDTYAGVAVADSGTSTVYVDINVYLPDVPAS